MTKTPAQLDREVAEVLTRGASVDGKQPLYLRKIAPRWNNWLFSTVICGSIEAWYRMH